MNNKNRIELEIELDEQKLPASIHWSASGAGNSGQPSDCKAFLLALFERESKETLKVDIWTKDMEVHEMDRFFFYWFRIFF